MNDSSLTCRDEQRRQEVRHHTLNGLDYLEVELFDRDGQPLLHPILSVRFLGKAPEQTIEPENVRIEGGRRILGRDLRILSTEVQRQEDPELDDSLIITVDKSGDFSIYTLQLVAVEDGHPTEQSFPGFDQRYSRLQFSFKADCPSDLDCKIERVCPPEKRDAPEINYLAKDYASFRQLILDRLALIMPDWQERHVPDLGIALVEVLAYAGDYLSYHQDAVATEAYLDTARQRISVRRHVRLVDYPMHEGCNARAWVCGETDTDIKLDPNDIFFITRYNDALAAGGGTLSKDALRNIPRSQYEVFEPVTTAPIHLCAAHSKMHFYTWGDRQCCLPKGATAATLRDEWVTAAPEEPPKYSPRQKSWQYPAPGAGSSESVRRLHLQVGDVLIFEEVIGPKTGDSDDADPTHRHAVRLTKVTQSEDQLYDPPIPVFEIEWAAEDALPFPLCISAIGPAPECALICDISVARGNVILVDHGERIEDESLGAVEVETTVVHCEGEGQATDVMALPKRFYPHLEKGPQTFREVLPQDVPALVSAFALLDQNPRRALPQIRLNAIPPARWIPQRDLLNSSEQDQHFVAEVDNDGRAHLRFGDGELGRMPAAGTAFRATYRAGNGLAGNVGAEAISHIVFRQSALSGGITRIRNPMPAKGGVDPEPLAEIKLFAPHAFRSDLQRAITADDYARLAVRNPKVQRAAAALRWTGSWYEALVAIDPLGTEQVDETLLNEIHGCLYRYRRMGHDLVVQPAHYVPLDIELDVCVKPHYLRGHVEAALLDVFGNRALSDGRLGFFHPDNLSFGEGINLSNLVASAQAVEGVQSVKVSKLQRKFEAPNHEIESGILPLGPTEIAQLDNDPSFPEHGTLALVMRGGR